jgi:hypothetical protein
MVTGTTAPGAAVEVSAGQPGSPANATSIVSTMADAQGHFSATVPTPSGATVITVTAAKGTRATGWAQTTVTGGA